MKTIIFFNNKKDVGKSSLIYHLAWAYADSGVKVLAADFDPQSDLTRMFLNEDQQNDLWPESEHTHTLFSALKPILKGLSDINKPYLKMVTDEIGLLVGDLGLSLLEDPISDAWNRCLDNDASAFKITSLFKTILSNAYQEHKADIALIDIGSNLGAINRAALLAADYVIVPLSTDSLSLQAFKSLGSRLHHWCNSWQLRLQKNTDENLSLPPGKIQQAGYIILQHSPFKVCANWPTKVPDYYYKEFLNQDLPVTNLRVDKDDQCLSIMRHYRCLMLMSREAHKPIFHLKPADGSIGVHVSASIDCGREFKKMARRIAKVVGIDEDL